MHTVGHYISIMKSSKGRGGDKKVTKITSMMEQTLDIASSAAAAASLDSEPDTPPSEDELQFVAQIAKQRNANVSPPGGSTPSDDG